MKKLLITGDPDGMYETVLLVGNGAIEGGNAPLRDAIALCEEYERYGDNQKEYKNSNPDLVAYLSAIAFVARDNRYSALRLLSENGTLSEEEKGIFNFHVDYVNRLRIEIGNAFVQAKANNKIAIRDLKPVLRYLDLSAADKFGVISLNWDELMFGNNLFSGNRIDLHGCASEPDSMIFPMESTTDDVILDLFLKNSSIAESSEEMALINKSFRNKAVRQHHDYIHHIAQRWFSNAKKIIIWGVAFNSYDAELMSLIPKDDRDRNLILINPDSRARDVAGTMLSGSPKRRTDYDPVRNEEILKR